MSPRLYRILQSLMLVGLGAFLAVKIVSGSLTLYINQRFVTLTSVGVLLLTIMVLALLKRIYDDHTNSEHIHAAPEGLALLLIPVLMGVLLPARPLDAAAVASKGITVNAPLISAYADGAQFEAASTQRNILDWIRIISYESDLSPYLGQQAKVTGFVYYPDGLPQGQFFISRFVVTCCAADGFALGVPVEWNGQVFEENDWVIVEGPVQVTEWNGEKIPLIIAESVQLTDEPEQPYLIP
mgnify:CR=1 FL=1